MASEELNHLFLVLTGQEMPDLDPVLMHDHLVLPQRELEQQLAQLQELLVRVAQSVSAQSTGEFSEAYYEAMLTLASPEGTAILAGLRDATKQLGDFAEESVYQVEYTNLMIRLQLGLFLVEFAVTLVMSIWNPWGAMLRQAFLRALYRNILNSLVFKLTSAIVSQQILQIGLAAAMDRLAQWSLARQGKVSANGSTYLKQSVIFGSISGFVAVPVQFGASALAQSVIKRMHKGGGDSLFNSLSDALTNRPDPKSLNGLRNLAGDTAGDVADDTSDNGVGGAPKPVARPGNDLGGFTGDSLPAFGGGAAGGPDRVFARDFTDRVTDVANRISRDHDPLRTDQRFVDDMGDLFARRFGDDLGGEDAARTLGRDWAGTFLGNVHRDDLGRSLRSVLDGRLPASLGDGVLRALSRSVQDLFGAENLSGRFLSFTLHGIGDGVIGLGSEMIFNGITQKTFSVSGGGFLTSITSERAADIFNSGADWLASKFKPGNLGLGVDVKTWADVNKVPLGSGPGAPEGTGTGTGAPAPTRPHPGGGDAGPVRPGAVNTVGAGGGPGAGVFVPGDSPGTPAMPVMPTADGLRISGQPIGIPDLPVLIPQVLDAPAIDTGPPTPQPVTNPGDMGPRGAGPGDSPGREDLYGAPPRSGDLRVTTPGESGRDLPEQGSWPTSPAPWNPAEPRPSASRPADTASPGTPSRPDGSSAQPHPTSTAEHLFSTLLPDTDTGMGTDPGPGPDPSDDASDAISLTSDSSLVSDDSFDSITSFASNGSFTSITSFASDDSFTSITSFDSTLTNSTARTDPDPDSDPDTTGTGTGTGTATDPKPEPTPLIPSPTPEALPQAPHPAPHPAAPFPHTALTPDQLRTTVRDAIAATLAQNPAHLDECVILLEQLARLLYPHNTPEAFREPHRPAPAGSGIRPAQTVDDLDIGTQRAARRLAAGPGWAPVTDWTVLDEALEAAGTGSTALILTQSTTGPGHAYAAHRTTEGTRWTELQAKSADEQVTRRPPAPAPHDTHAVVITPAGRVARESEGALPHAPDHTTSTALTDPPLTTAYKGFGFEAELKYTLGSPSALAYGDILAVHSTGLKIVVDKDTFYLGSDGYHYHTEEAALAATGMRPQPVTAFIPEVVSPATSTLPGEQKRPGHEVLQAYFATRGHLDGAYAGPSGDRLDHLLSADSRWFVQPAGSSVTVMPTSAGPGHAAYAQFTVGVPLAGLTPVLDLTRLRLESPPIGSVSDAGRTFADWVTARYAHGLLGIAVPPQRVPFLSYLPVLAELHGYIWLAFNHVVTPLVVQETNLGALVKSFLAAASRTPFATLLGSLNPSARSFLAHDQQAIATRFEQGLRHLVRRAQRRPDTDPAPDLDDVLDRVFATDRHGRELTTRDYLLTALRGRSSFGAPLDQEQTVGMRGYTRMDNDGGNLRLPLALLELRHYSPEPPLRTPGRDSRLMTDQAFNAASMEIVNTSRLAYQRAERMLDWDPAQPGQALTALFQHPTAQRVADVFAAVQDLGLTDRTPVLPPVERASLARLTTDIATVRGVPPQVVQQVGGLLSGLGQRIVLGLTNPALAPELRPRFQQAQAAVQSALQTLGPPPAQHQQPHQPQHTTAGPSRTRADQRRSGPYSRRPDGRPQLDHRASLALPRAQVRKYPPPPRTHRAPDRDLPERAALRSSGEVVSDHWIPFRAAGGGRTGGDAFEFTRTRPGRTPFQVRRGEESGERIEVGYTWTWDRATLTDPGTLTLTRRIHLDDTHVTAEDAARVRSGIRTALDALINTAGYRLPALQPDVTAPAKQAAAPEPPGPALRVDVVFVAEAAAHDTVVLHPGPPRDGQPMTQNEWHTDVPPDAYVHEIVHGLGVRDSHPAGEPGGRSLLTPVHPPQEPDLGPGDSDLMGPFTDTPGPPRRVLTPDALRQIADTLTPYLHQGAPTPSARHPRHNGLRENPVTHPAATPVPALDDHAPNRRTGSPHPVVAGPPPRPSLGPGHASPRRQRHTPADPPTPDAPPPGTDHRSSRSLADDVFDTLMPSVPESEGLSPRPTATESPTRPGPPGTSKHDQRFPLPLLRNEVNLLLPKLGWARGAVDEATVREALHTVRGPARGVNLRDLAEEIAGRIIAGRAVRMRAGARGGEDAPPGSADTAAGPSGDPAAAQDTADQQAGPSSLTRRTPPAPDNGPDDGTADGTADGTDTAAEPGRDAGTDTGPDDDGAAGRSDAPEVFYSREIARHLETEPLDTRALLALLQRWSSSPRLLDSSLLQTAYRDLTGTELATDLNRAAEQGRLGLVDLPAVTRRLGLSVDTRPAGEVLPHMAAKSPSAEPNLPAVVEYATRVRLAYEDNNPQRALALLDALDRDLRKVWTVEAAWRRQYGDAMGPALATLWPSYGFRIADALGYADRAVVPVAQVGAWYRQLADVTFEHHRHGTVPVTTGHPEDGCFYRSHLWALQLLRWGVMPQKVYAARGGGTKLTVTTPTALNSTRDTPGQVFWSFHVAPVVHAVVADGSVVPLVLDPTLQRGLLTIPQWMQTLGLSSQPGTYRFHQGPLAQVHHHMVVDRQQRPGAWTTSGPPLPLEPTLLLTDAHSHSFPYPSNPPIGSWQESNARVLENSNRLYRHHVRAVRRELARTLDRILADAPAGHPSGQLLERLRTEVERHRPMPGFLQERPDFDSEAHRLLTSTDYDLFASLFPPPKPGHHTVEESSDGETSEEEEPDPDDRSSHEDSSGSDHEEVTGDQEAGDGEGDEEQAGSGEGEPSS
ncbi:protein-glutamine glutaminase family protein [Streptomyces sp. NPDC093252]|uniref:protein-glutamine glutaminase family protein n=1 Tax=Streptomyces sp. NPDC093252 TaxID=3154980 RepID=UPI003441DEEA